MKKLISWVEIPVTDFDRALSFYNAILEIEMEVIELGEEKMACFPSGDGAISLAPDFKPSKDGTLVSLNAENNLESMLKSIVDNGGEILKGKTKIDSDELGYFALFIDSEGNKVGLYGDA